MTPAKISRQRWAPRDDIFLNSSWTGSGTRFTSARPRSGNVISARLPSEILPKASAIGSFRALKS